MISRQVNRALNPPQLDAELRAVVPALFGSAGGLPITRYTLTALGPDQWQMEVPDDADVAAITAVLQQHQASVRTAQQDTEAGDTLTLADLRAQYQAMKAGLTTIRGHMATIQASANPTTANLAALQRVVDAVKQEAGDITTLCNGLDRLLDTLAVIVRRQAG